MGPKWIIPFLVMALSLVWGCGRGDIGTQPTNPDVVASFNGGVITKDQLKAKFDGLMPCCKERYQGVEGRKNLIKEMVLPVVISDAIKKKKIDLRANIREELGNLTDELNISFLHMKFHEQILNSNEKYRDLRENYEFQKKRLEGVPLSERYERLVQLHQQIHPEINKEVDEVGREYLRKLREEASITKNYEVLRIKVTEDELKDFYQKHQQGLHDKEYQVPERVRIEEIRVKVDKGKEDCPTCPEEKRAQEIAQAVLTELRSGADFQKVASRYTNNIQEAMQPRWIDRGSTGKEFDEAVFSLEVGEISQVLRNEDGNSFSIVKILEKRPGHFKPYREIRNQIEKEYRWQKGEDYLKENRDRILFTINAKPYTVGDFINEYTRKTPPHQCHHMEGMDTTRQSGEPPKLCDFAHNNFEDQKKIVDRMVDRELIVEDTYNQMIHVEHQKQIEFLTMATLYPLFHQEEMEGLIQISDKTVEDYYQKHKEDYQYPAKAKIRLIMTKGGEKKEEKERAYEKANKAYRELKPSFFLFKKGKEFAEVARKFSDDEETASKGGLLEIDVHECRNAIEYMLFHGFHKKIFALKPGDISDVFEFGDNYYLVQIMEMEGRKKIPFNEVREEVKKDLSMKEHQKVMEKWEQDLLRSARFAVYDQTLKKMMAEVPAETKKTKKVGGL